MNDIYYYDNNGMKVSYDEALPMFYQGVIEGFEDTKFTCPNSFTTGEVGRSGITLLPDKGRSGVNSPDKDIYIYINSQFSDIGKAESFSHEGYGHAFLYVLTRDRNISRHIADLQHDTNERLVREILRARKENVDNINKH